MRTDEGQITIAYGNEKYIRMAKALALSHKRFSPNRPLIVVTDRANEQVLGKYFEGIIPLKAEYGSGVVQKLHVDLYSPFKKTLFVDCDCLFYKDPSGVWDIYEKEDFGVRRWRYLTGNSEYEKKQPYEQLVDTTSSLRKIGINRLAHFNSGLFFSPIQKYRAKCLTLPDSSMNSATLSTL